MSVVHIDFDTITPTPLRTVQSTPILPMASTHTTVQSNTGMSNATKIGLSMIPVVVFTVGLYMLFLFLYQKRRAARKQAQKPPSVPEKDIRSYNSSLASRRRSSKVLHMSAFSTPIHDDRQRTTERRTHNATIPDQCLEINVDQVQMVAAPKKSSRIEPPLDSPIDGSSPFHLKRGDTVKRHSLGPELARLWPSTPASAWLGPLNEEDDLPAPTYGTPAQRPYRNTAIY
jgi:hypothetical protein